MAHATASSPVDFVMRVESGDEMTAVEYVEGCALLIASGLAQGLQGSWQRALHSLIEQGVVSAEGVVDDDVLATILEEA